MFGLRPLPEEKNPNLDSAELEKKIEKIMNKKMENEMDKFVETKVGKMITEKDIQDKARKQKEFDELFRGRRPVLLTQKSRANHLQLDECMDWYRGEFQSRFWEIDRQTEEFKRKLASRTSNKRSSGKIGHNTSGSGLPPLAKNQKGGEKNKSPSGSDTPSMREREDKDQSISFDEVPDMTRLNSVLRAKLKPYANAPKEEEEDEYNFRKQEKLEKANMYKGNVRKSLEKSSFIQRISHSPYLNNSLTRSRGSSAKKFKRESQKFLTQGLNSSMTEQDISDEHNASIQKSDLNTSKDILDGVLLQNKSTLLDKQDGIRKAYHINYTAKKRSSSGIYATNTVVSRTPNKFNNRTIIGGVSNLIKPGLQITQPKKPQASDNKPRINVKRSASVISEVNENSRSSNSRGGNVTLNPSSPTKSPRVFTEARLNSRGGIVNNGNLLRQVYRIKTVVREDSK